MTVGTENASLSILRFWQASGNPTREVGNQGGRPHSGGGGGTPPAYSRSGALARVLPGGSAGRRFADDD
jgi:hypothetical protein